MIIGQDITVIGAGVAGLATGIALAQRGAKVRILEQAESIREIGAGLQISPNGFAVLKALGLGEAILKVAVRANAVELRDYKNSKQVLRLDLAGLASDQHYLFVHRADLIEMLATAARDVGVQIRLLQKIQSVTERDGGGYCINTAQGGEHKASCLIGADGIHSPIRQFLNGASAPFFTHQVAWRATVPNDADVAHKVQVHMGPGRHIVGYPLRGGELINIVAVQEKQAWVEESWTKKDDPDHLRAIFSDFAPSVRSLLSRIEEVHQWGLFRHSVAKTWYRGQAAILGDAAHPTLPFLAQGACMALEDAWVLAESLAQTDEISVGLAQYQSKRKDRVTRVVDAATKNAWRYHLSFPPLRFATHTALRTAGALAPSMAIRQFDWLYRTDVTKA